MRGAWTAPRSPVTSIIAFRPRASAPRYGSSAASACALAMSRSCWAAGASWSRTKPAGNGVVHSARAMPTSGDAVVRHQGTHGLWMRCSAPFMANGTPWGGRSGRTWAGSSGAALSEPASGQAGLPHAAAGVPGRAQGKQHRPAEPLRRREAGDAPGWGAPPAPGPPPPRRQLPPAHPPARTPSAGVQVAGSRPALPLG